jgi:hypothetical protein
MWADMAVLMARSHDGALLTMADSSGANNFITVSYSRIQQSSC